MFSSCKMMESERLEVLLQQWNGKEIFFPKNLSFMEYGEKRVDFDISKGRYKIVHYVDSAGCAKNEFSEIVNLKGDKGMGN